MQSLDVAILLLLNSFARQSWLLDSLVMRAAETPLLKGGVLVALLWWSWERTGAKRPAPPVIPTLVGALLAVAAARGLQNFLPSRPRPLHEPVVAEAGFLLPFGVPSDVLRDYSSFPSDHAVLAFALATALFVAHRAMGAFAYAWAFLISCLPRVYVGFHYLSDVVGGGAIGVIIMALALRLPMPERASQGVAQLAQAHRGWLYAGLFLLTYQMATVFTDARQLAATAVNVLEFLL